MGRKKPKRKSKSVRKDKRIWWVGTMIFGVVIVMATVLSVVKISGERPEVKKMEVVLSGTTLEQVNSGAKETKYEGNTVILGEDEDAISFENVRLKGRGNYSWGDVKKSYQLKFEKKTELFGIGRSKKWALISNNLDDSMLRNDLAQYLARLIGMKYNFGGEYVELTMDGEELGLYYLTRTVAIGKEKVNLKDPMGVLVELDNNYCEFEDKQYKTVVGDCLVAKDAVNEDNEEAAMADFLATFNKLQKAAESGDYETVKELADVESLAQYFIISEFSANPDAYNTSYYFYKDGRGDKIHAGPVWDFDGAFGNRNFGLGAMDEEFYDPWSNETRKKDAFSWNFIDDDGTPVRVQSNAHISKILLQLTKVPEFSQLVARIYRERLSGERWSVQARIDERAELIREAALKDTEMWEKKDFDEAVEYLKWWVEQRFLFFDSKFDSGVVPWLVEKS